MTTTEQNAASLHESGLRMSEEVYEQWALTSECRSEWVEGEVIVMSPASFDHERLASWLHYLIHGFVSKHQLGTVLVGNLMVRLASRRRVPDLLFVAKDRQGDFQKNFFEGAPTLVIEIVSPDSESRDWREKYLEYEAAGVPEYWIIDPTSGAAEFYQLHQSKFRRIPIVEGVFNSVQLPGFWLKLQWLTSHPLPNSYEIAKQMVL